MPGRILIVDSVSTNRIVLKARLARACPEVMQAAGGAEALARVARDRPDAVVLGGDLPDMTQAALCTALRGAGRDERLPVLALAQPGDRLARLAALRAGADDVLDRAPDMALLLARLRSLLRARESERDFALRDGTRRALGMSEAPAGFEVPARLVLLAHDRRAGSAQARALREALRWPVELASARETLRGTGRGGGPEAVMVVLDPEDAEAGLELIPALRAQVETRRAALLALAPEGCQGLAARALDLGARDALAGPFDAEELALRLRALVADTRRAAWQRAALRNGLRAAMTDPLTGLYNRRYALPQLSRIADAALRAGRGCAVMVADLDHFKKVNDRHGHAAGDAVLVEVARRLRAALRPGDMAARLGGEEFLLVMGGLSGAEAERAARQLCETVAARPVPLPGLPEGIPVTLSIGVAVLGGAAEGTGSPADRLLEEADRALYGAKRRGRNMVTLGRPAA